MDYKTNNDKYVITDGTSFRGEIDCSYKTLLNIFGKPSKEYDGYKSDAEWQIEFSDGMVVTIYNYKDGVNYNGEDGIPTEKLTDWHIGGKDSICVDRIKSIVDDFVDSTFVEHPLEESFLKDDVDYFLFEIKNLIKNSILTNNQILNVVNRELKQRENK